MPGPTSQPRGVHPESDLQWLDLADFSAGIYDNSHVSGTNPNVPGPTNAADPDHTFSCIALPKGGLGPLPALSTVTAWPGPTVTGAGNYIVGLLVHNELADGSYEAVAIWDGNDGTTHHWQAWSVGLFGGSNDLIVDDSLPSTGPGLFGAPYPQMTRAAATDPTTTVGNPVVVFPAPSTDQYGQVYMYPDPSAPTVYGALALITAGSSTAGQVLVHQSRVIVLGTGVYPYPAGGGFSTNEQIAFTDPPNSTVLGPADTVLATEQPYGYGGGGSISAGELFLVKKRGGAIVVTGDIFSPNVTILPGVQGTGGFYGSAHSGLAGFVYCSYDNGAWAWNGGSTAQKISTQLDDSFFLPPEWSTIGSNNYGYYVRCIADRVYVSNNWLYDLNTQSWWRYYPTKAQGGQDLFYVQETDGQFIYGGRLSFSDTDTDFLYEFDQQAPTGEWQWQCLPRRLTDNRLIELREVVVRASSNQGAADSQITVAIYNGATKVGSVTTVVGDIKAYPTMLRMPIGAISAGSVPYTSEDFTIRITATGNGGPAPNLHSVSLGWKQTRHAPTIGVGS